MNANNLASHLLVGLQATSLSLVTIVASASAQPLTHELARRSGAKPAAGIEASIRFEPLAGELELREGFADGSWSDDASATPRWISRHEFELVYEAESGRLTWSDARGEQQLEATVTSALADEGPNLLRIELLNLDPRASARLEGLELHTGDEILALGDHGRGAMTRDLAEISEPELERGFRLTGVLAIEAPSASPSKQVSVEFGLGRGPSPEERATASGDARAPAAPKASGFYQFDNYARITVPAYGTSGVATPYPSTIAVSGIPGVMTDVNVWLNYVSHTWPGDLDIMVVAPVQWWRANYLASDACGSVDISSALWHFNDEGSARLPYSGGCQEAREVSSIFSYYGCGDDYFPPPAEPSAPTDCWGALTDLYYWQYSSPNGTWSLYVFDDTGGDVGVIWSGWTLEVTTFW